MTISRAATFTAKLCDCYCPDEPGETPTEVIDGRCTVCALMVLTDDVQAEVDELARRWSFIQTEIEHEGFARQARYEDGADYSDEDDEPGVAAGAAMRQQLKDGARQAELATIEAMLAERGARMMRPYEHWNEDERYMSMAEGEG